MSMGMATIQTPLAARYLTQLCKHFEHKLPVTHGGGAGQINFSVGVCSLSANDSVLRLIADAPDEASLIQLQDVVARHLARFAFREAPSVAWSKTA